MAEQTKKVTLKDRDGNVYKIEEDVIEEFGILKLIIDEKGYAESSISIPNIESGTFAKVMEYCRKCFEFRTRADQDSAGDQSADTKAFDDKFVNGLNNYEMKELILASNYLKFKKLLDLLLPAIADRIKNKSVKYVRKFFDIESDYTPEEENALREKHAWAFEGVDDD